MHEPIYENVCTYLDDYGWGYHRDESGLIVTGFLSEQNDRQFNMFIVVSQQWIGMTIWPLIDTSEIDDASSVDSRICQLNFSEIKMARLARTGNGDLALCIDLPAADLTKCLFHRALDTLSYYSERFYIELFLKE